jgi:hypothetical protein
LGNAAGTAQDKIELAILNSDCTHQTQQTL